MAFYKLFCKLHRRTDYYKLHREAHRIMNPEFYNKVDNEACLALKRLNILSSTIKEYCNSYFSRNL